jgi:hypothetical protein
MTIALTEMLEKDYPKPRYTNYRDIIIGTREDAREVLGLLQNFIDNYGVVTVADLLDSVGETSSIIDVKYGWVTSFGAYVAKDKNGWTLKLPRPRLLDNDTSYVPYSKRSK